MKRIYVQKIEVLDCFECDNLEVKESANRQTKQYICNFNCFTTNEIGLKDNETDLIKELDIWFKRKCKLEKIKDE